MSEVGVLQSLLHCPIRARKEETESGRAIYNCRSVCDWLVYWSVQSLETTVLTPNFFCVMSLYLSRIAHVELEELMRQSLIVQRTAL